LNTDAFAKLLRGAAPPVAAANTASLALLPRIAAHAELLTNASLMEALLFDPSGRRVHVSDLDAKKLRGFDNLVRLNESWRCANAATLALQQRAYPTLTTASNIKGGVSLTGPMDQHRGDADHGVEVHVVAPLQPTDAFDHVDLRGLFNPAALAHEGRAVAAVVASWPNAWSVGVVILFPAQRMGIATAKGIAGRPNTRVDRMERMRGREFDAVVLAVNCVPEDDPSLPVFFRDALPFVAGLSRSRLAIVSSQGVHRRYLQDALRQGLKGVRADTPERTMKHSASAVSP
jgi:hypothetical protein